MAEAAGFLDYLAARIRVEGPISFSSFMREALYHPVWGYYADPERRIGRGGDFYTSVCVGPLYGELLADVFASMWVALGRPREWILVEQGGHDGVLARDILQALKAHHRDSFDAVRWIFIEEREAWRQAQAATLEAAGLDSQMEWPMSAGTFRRRPGIFFSNELVDAFPVDRVVRRGGSWKEVRVTWDATSQTLGTSESQAAASLVEAVERTGAPEVDGYEVEINVEARPWVRTWDHWLESGFTVTVDYGDAAPHLWTLERTGGTLRTYAAHEVGGNVLAEPGRRDLTAHVDFSVLVDEGRRRGWTWTAWTDQHRFLTSAAEAGWMERMETALVNNARDAATSAALRQFRTLTHPEIMGRAFRVLVMSKGVSADGSAGIAGLKYNRPFPGFSDQASPA
jgi:SAM-dependent MidA family methyltransferase